MVDPGICHPRAVNGSPHHCFLAPLIPLCSVAGGINEVIEVTLSAHSINDS